MKYIFIAILSCFGCNAFSQTQFEGKIIYDVASAEKNGNGQMTIFFGKPGIRLEASEANGKNESEILIINLDSGKIFTLNREEKKYKESVMKKKIQTAAPAKKDIAGFATIPVVMESLGMPRDFAAIFGSSVLYPANELFYKTPDVYTTNPELMMINKGRIVLGGEFYLPEYPENQWNLNNSVSETKEKQKLFSVFARQVFSEKIDAALFVIPADYTEREHYDYSLDSTTAAMDTAAMYPVDSVGMPIKEVPVKKKSSPSKKKSITRQNAINRKDE